MSRDALAQNLRFVRRSLGWSQAELARRSGVSKSTIGHIEAGGIDPGFSSVVRLAQAMQVTLEELASRPSTLLTRTGVKDFPVVKQLKGVGRILRMVPDPFSGVDLFWVEFVGRGVLPGVAPGMQGKRLLFCVQGEIVFQGTGHAPIPLLKGQAVLFSSQEKHSFSHADAAPAAALLVTELRSESASQK